MNEISHNESLTDLVERLLHVRSFPAFAKASQEQAGVIARHMRVLTFSPCVVLFRKGEVADRLYLVIDGAVRLERDGGPVRVGPYEPAGGHSLLEGLPHDSTAVAETQVRAFVLWRDDLFDLLEEHFDLALATIASLTGRLLLRRGPLRPAFGLGGWRPPREISAEADLARKLIYLRSLRQLDGLTVHGMIRLAAESTIHSAAASEVLYSAGERSDTYWLLLRGRVGMEGQEGSWEAPFAPGQLHVLGQGLHDETCVVQEPSLLLRAPATAWFDMMEDHFDLVRSLLARLSRAIRESRSETDRAAAAA